MSESHVKELNCAKKRACQNINVTCLNDKHSIEVQAMTTFKIKRITQTHNINASTTTSVYIKM